MVKKYPHGKASGYLHSLSPGDSLLFLTTLKGYRWTPNQYPSITLIAGGAGITPCYQLIQGILGNPSDNTKITLIFGVNSNQDILLRSEFKDFEERYPERFKAIYTVSNTAERSEFRTGYVTKQLLEEVVGSKKDGEETKIFVCGPPAMENALLGAGRPFGRGQKGILEQLGYGKGMVHKF
jgi:cytochrome-b5 reductase